MLRGVTSDSKYFIPQRLSRLVQWYSSYQKSIQDLLRKLSVVAQQSPPARLASIGICYWQIKKLLLISEIKENHLGALF
jgi:hypothetical protein